MSGIESGASGKRRSPERTVRHGLVEQEIFDHATRLFAERGFSGTTLQHIADAVGLTRPGIYHYVKSKDDLLSRLLAEYTEDSATQINAIAARTDLDSPSRLREIVTLLARRQGEHAARFRLIIRSESDLPNTLATRYEQSRHAVLRSLATVIDRGITEGAFRTVDARVAALGILGTVNWVAWWFDPDHNDNLDAISHQLADTAVAGLLDVSGRQPVDGPHAAIAAIRAQVDRLERTLRS
ncbi:TetR/AcrR family transcriptional regulator [Amycolatopsis pithecellobii]|uniref:TetR family transcriptional regulator n=1 Tax=Amycolatopsis pithecellobii TaxID=664692 RepID=A0A6N7YXW9_9PSEU|nr:TetR/AcrR family transcriptional regulator [Amycolatopsis pithecellobii]MTD53199.1 TetR family transcriptional regulator [Amycolatopsis pithecellobii]